MVNSNDKIEAKIDEIYNTLDSAYYTPVDQTKIIMARSDIFDLLEAIAYHLHGRLITLSIQLIRFIGIGYFARWSQLN